MAKNDFKAFATGDDANVLSQQDYEALVARSSGFQSGIAQSAQMNKVLRQSSIMAAVLAQFIVDQAGKDAIDNGSVDTLVENLKAAIFNDTALTGVPTAPTPGAGDDSTRLATTAFVQQLSGNFATQHWVRDSAVNKAGDTMTGTLNTPNLSVNQGVENDTSATLIYNDQGRRNIVFRTGPAGQYKYSVINEDGVLRLPERPAWNATPWDTDNFEPNGKAEVDSPTFVGVPTGPTPEQFDSSKKLANMEALQRALGNYANVAVVNKATTLTRFHAGQIVELNGGSSFVTTLPEGSTLGMAGAISFVNHSGTDQIIAAQGTDSIWAYWAGKLKSITLRSGDSLKLFFCGDRYDICGGSAMLQFSTSFGSSLTANGYQKIPSKNQLSGLIWQWGMGTAAASRTSVTSLPVVFPLAFPNTLLSVTGSANNWANSSEGGMPTWGVQSPNRSGFTAILDSLAYTVFDIDVPFFWCAVGC